MSTAVTLSGQTYYIPAYDDDVWAQGSGNLSSYLIAVASQIASTPSFMQTVVVTTSPQTVVSGKTYLATTSIALTFNLPTPVVNTWFIIKDKSGTASTNNITLHRAASESIDGVASDYTFKTNWGSLIVISDGTNWFLIGNDQYKSDLVNTGVGSGVEVTTPDGTGLYRIGVDNNGDLTVVKVN
jgi:hypothetical protein